MQHGARCCIQSRPIERYGEGAEFFENFFIRQGEKTPKD
jgi:hypothetical protein